MLPKQKRVHVVSLSIDYILTKLSPLREKHNRKYLPINSYLACYNIMLLFKLDSVL